MRLFVALPIPDELRDVTGEVVAEVRASAGEGLRWPRPEGWHVTLAFLGEVPAERAGEVAAVLDAVASTVTPMDLRSGAAGRFGRGVLWLGVDDDPCGSVARLGEAVQAAVEAAGLAVERRDVHPHVTLARGGKRKVDDALVRRVEVPPLAWRATSMQLWSSRLGDGPARYEVEHEAWFGGSGAP